MTYDAIERSVQGAKRVDLFAFDLPGVTYRLCSGSGDQTYDGNTFSVAPIGCSSIPLVGVGGRVREVTISLPLDHDLAVELRRGGVPPQSALVTIRRLHIGDSETKPWWRGYVGSTSTDGALTRIRVPSKTDLALACDLPAKLAERRCPHFLGDTGCGVDLVAGGFRLTPTVAAVSTDRMALDVSSMSSKPDRWATNGKIVRVADGEKRTIVGHAGTVIALDFPFRTLEIGDALEVYAGCDRSLLQDNGCKVKFNNVARFGGEPELPTDNPSSPTGAGVRV